MTSHPLYLWSLEHLFAGPPAIIEVTPLHPAIEAALNLAEYARQHGRLLPPGVPAPVTTSPYHRPAMHFYLQSIARDMAHVHKGEARKILEVLRERFPEFG